jgi:hypothetical protein
MFIVLSLIGAMSAQPPQKSFRDRIAGLVAPLKILMLLFFTLLAGASGWTQSLDEVTLPAKTDIFLQLQRTLNSRTALPGDKFPTVVEVPVTHEDRVVIPVGSFIIGQVVESETAGRLKGKADLLLAFDTVILPDGTTRTMKAAVRTAEGYASDPVDETGRIEASGSKAADVAGRAAEGAVGGAVTGATIGLFRAEALRSLGIGAAIGAAGGGLIGLLRRGEEVELPRGSSLIIQLQDPVIFVRPTPPPEGRRLEP